MARFKLRDADLSDAGEIRAIYAPFITSSIASLEFEVPTEAEMKCRISGIQRDFPWLVYEFLEDHSIAGYAYASRHRERVGYQWTVETGIYISERFRGQGIGRMLYEKLFEILRAQGFYQALAGISGGNENSVEFHKKLGFELAGKWKNIGNKFGKWCDVSWFSKDLQTEYGDNPATPLKYSEMKTKFVS